MDKPYIYRIEKSEGLDEAIIFINGYISAKSENANEWRNGLRQAGWKGAIYQLWWDSSSEGSQALAIGVGAVGAGVGAVVGGVGAVVGGLSHWEKVKIRAKTVGEDYFSNLLSANVSENYISLIGYSLGARVIYYGMKNWSTYSKTVKNIILVAGAISRKKEWDKVAGTISGNLINLYNEDDSTLKKLYDAAGLMLKSSPVGIKVIDSSHSKIINANATDLMNTKSHDLEGYLRVMPQKVGQILWSYSGNTTSNYQNVTYQNSRYENFSSSQESLYSSDKYYQEKDDNLVEDIAKNVGKGAYKAGKTVGKGAYKAGKTVAKGVKKAFKFFF